MRGKSLTRTYRAWVQMKARVGGKDAVCKKHYVDRGITVCAEWQDFERFLRDMRECPPGLSLDRIDNDDGYRPGNCRWTTQKQQTSNTRRTIWVVYQGERLCLKDACAVSGLDYHRVRSRIRYGATPQDAFDHGDKRWHRGLADSEYVLRRVGMTGKHHSEATRMKLSAALKGRHLLEETKLKMSTAQKARYL